MLAGHFGNAGRSLTNVPALSPHVVAGFADLIRGLMRHTGNSIRASMYSVVNN
jgi:hypothetical protein